MRIYRTSFTGISLRLGTKDVRGFTNKVWFIFSTYVAQAEKWTSFPNLKKDSVSFLIIWLARYDADVTLQDSNTSSENMAGKMEYRSCKQKKYVYNDKLVVSQIEICIISTNHYGLSTSDLKWFGKSEPLRKEFQKISSRSRHCRPQSTANLSNQLMGSYRPGKLPRGCLDSTCYAVK